MSNSRQNTAPLLGESRTDRKSRTDAATLLLVLLGLVVVPLLYLTDNIDIVQVNMLGRYLCFAIVAVSLDLIWGYTGLLCLCQSLFFALGGYAMGMYLAHHGGPEGIVDATGWKMPACLYYVYPGGVGETQKDWLVPLFWKPFYWFEFTTILGLLIPGLVAMVIGFFVFRSRVRGVFFAILTQALTLAVWLVFSMNKMKLCGTNGLTRFERVGPFFDPEHGGSMNKLVILLTVFLGINLFVLVRAILRQTRPGGDAAGRGFWKDPLQLAGLVFSLAVGLGCALWIKGYVVANVEDLDELRDTGVKFILYLVTVAVLLDVYLLCRYIVNSRLGRVLVAIRDKESRLRFSGYKPYVYKVFIFSVSAMIAGLGGMLYAPQMGIFTPTNLEPKESILVVIWVAVGGRSSLSGPIIGALFVNLVYNYLTGSAPETWPFLQGALFVAVVLARPDGLISLKRDFSWYRKALGRYCEFSDFQGRSRRKEYWYFTVFHLLFLMLLTTAAMLVDPGGFSKVFSLDTDLRMTTSFLRLVLWSYAGLVAFPCLAVTIRRLQDTGRAFWWMFVVVAVPLSFKFMIYLFSLAMVGTGAGSLAGGLSGLVEMIQGVFLLGVLAIIFGLLIGVVAIYAGCWCCNMRAGSPGDPGVHARPGIGRVLGIVAATGSLTFGAAFLLGLLFSPQSFLLLLPLLAFLFTATMIKLLLPATFPRAASVAFGAWVIAALVCFALVMGLVPYTGIPVLVLILSLQSYPRANRFGEVPDLGAEAGDYGVEEEQQGQGLEMQERLSRVANIQRLQGDKPQIEADILSVHDLTVVFDGFKALDIEEFHLPHYMLQVIIGPNGAGKTTLCDVISGKTRPTTGRVLFNGEDITEASEADIALMGVGRKFQTPTIYDSLTVFQNMELALPNSQRLTRNLWRGTSGTERDRIFQMLRRVRLDDDANRLVKFLSHGQRQWLEISMLILSDPKLLLVDEPAAGLTDEETVLTAELLLELQEDHSIIVIEHDMEFVRLLNAPVVVLNEGLIMASGSMEEVQADERVVEAYLGR